MSRTRPSHSWMTYTIFVVLVRVGTGRNSSNKFKDNIIDTVASIYRRVLLHQTIKEGRKHV